MMSVFSDENNKKYFKYIFIVSFLYAILVQIFIWRQFKTISVPLIFIGLIFTMLTLGVFYLYLKHQEEISKKLNDKKYADYLTKLFNKAKVVTEDGPQKKETEKGKNSTENSKKDEEQKENSNSNN